MLFLDFFKSCSGFALCKLTDSVTRDILLPLSRVGTALTRVDVVDVTRNVTKSKTSNLHRSS